MKQVREIPKIVLQLLSPPEGSGVVLEFLDEDDVAFMEINIDETGTRHVVVYETAKPISFPLSELKRGVEEAEVDALIRGGVGPLSAEAGPPETEKRRPSKRHGGL